MRRAITGGAGAALLTGCAALTLHRILPPAALLPVVAVAAVAPAALAVLTRRRSLWLAVPVSLLAWLLGVGGTVLRADAAFGVLPTAATLRGVRAGLREAWSQLFTTILPAPATPGLLVAVSAAVWLCSGTTALILVRTRATLPATVPPVVLLAAGVVLGAAGPGSNLVPVAGFVAAVGLLLVARGPRPVPAGLVAVAAVAVVAALVGPVIPVARDRTPFDPRRYVSPASRPRPALDPLDQISAWLAPPYPQLFTVAADSRQNWRIAVLDRFDGQTWRTADAFVSTAARVPVPPTTTRGQLVEQRVTIGALTGVWLPAAAQPVRVGGTPVLADPRTGVLLSANGLHPDLRYQVTSWVPEVTAEQLADAVPAYDPAELALPPGLPVEIAERARAATEGAGTPARQAELLAEYLRANETYDRDAPPGHSYGHLAHFLAVGHRGTSEEFATAFAVMARYLGLPTRVVVGFQSGTALSPGVFAVTGADALAWPEVEFTGLGWVPFYPTPAGAGADGAARSIPAGSSQARRQIDEGIVSVPVPAGRPPHATPPPRATRPPHPPARGAAAGRKAPLWTVLGGLALAAGVGYVGTVLLVPALRARRRRRARGGNGQVAAAWAQTLDRLRMAGLPDPSVLTTQQVAAWGADRLGPTAGGHLSALARLVDAAAFSGYQLPPVSGRSAWQEARAVGALARRATHPVRRLRYRLRPGAVRR